MLWRRGKSYSQDLRERVFAEADGGEAVSEIAMLLRVSVSYVLKVPGPTEDAVVQPQAPSVARSDRRPRGAP